MAQIITRDQFDKERGEYKAIQANGSKILKAHSGGLSAKAKQFYLDSQELSFVFERELVEELLSQSFTEFLRVYYGAIPNAKNKFGKKAGSPTIILAAARKINPYTDIGDLFVEWPTGLDGYGNEIP